MTNDKQKHSTTKQRIEDHHQQHEELKMTTKTNVFDCLPNDVLEKHIMAFVGRGKYRFVAPVNQRFKTCYEKAHNTNKTTNMLDAFLYMSTGKVLLNELENHYLLSIGNACKCIAGVGNVELLEWSRENGWEWNEGTCSAAARNGRLGTLMWARENGCPWDAWTCVFAALSGELETLKWARQNGCPWDAWTCQFAAQYGELETLKWARANGCPWNDWTCCFAAKNGELETLKWARENGCPWDEDTCQYAAGNGELETLKWARENGCPWDEERCRRAAEREGHSHIVEWINET